MRLAVADSLHEERVLQEAHALAGLAGGGAGAGARPAWLDP